MFRNSFIHKVLSEFLQPFWYAGIRASPNLFVILIFSLVLGFRLIYVTTLLMFQKCAGFPVLVYPHFHLTRLLDGDLDDQFPDMKESWVLKETCLRKLQINQEPRLVRSVPYYTVYSNTVLNSMWFLTVDPLIRSSMFIAKLSQR